MYTSWGLARPISADFNLTQAGKTSLSIQALACRPQFPALLLKSWKAVECPPDDPISIRIEWCYSTTVEQQSMLLPLALQQKSHPAHMLLESPGVYPCNIKPHPQCDNLATPSPEVEQMALLEKVIQHTCLFMVRLPNFSMVVQRWDWWLCLVKLPSRTPPYC